MRGRDGVERKPGRCSGSQDLGEIHRVEGRGTGTRPRDARCGKLHGEVGEGEVVHLGGRWADGRIEVVGDGDWKVVGRHRVVRQGEVERARASMHAGRSFGDGAISATQHLRLYDLQREVGIGIDGLACPVAGATSSAAGTYGLVATAASSRGATGASVYFGRKRARASRTGGQKQDRDRKVKVVLRWHGRQGDFLKT